MFVSHISICTFNTISLSDILLVGWEFLSSTPRPDRFWGPPTLLSNG